MNNTKKYIALLSSLFITISIIGCSPEVGSKQWCAEMKEKPKGDWTANQAADFTKSCLLQ